MGFVFLMSYANSAHRWSHVLTFNGMDYAFERLAMGLEKLERGFRKILAGGMVIPPHLPPTRNALHDARPLG